MTEKKLELQPRLQALADWVPLGARLTDVGTDHGYLPVFALQNSRVSYAIASDLRPEPLEHARRSAAEYGVSDSLDFRLCNGLEGIEAEETDCIVLAGMGGETIAAILAAAPWTAEGRHTLLLQPMTRAELLRLWLAQQGYRVLRERLVEDKGTIYPILEATGGNMPLPMPGQCHGGLLLHGDPLTGRYIDEQLTKLRRAESGLRKSRREEDDTRAAELSRIAAELETMKKEWAHGNSQGN